MMRLSRFSSLLKVNPTTPSCLTSTSQGVRRFASEADAAEKEDLGSSESVESTESVEEERTEEEKRIATLEALCKTLNEKYKTSLADLENYRKISQRDVTKAREFGAEKMVKKLFPVVDTLDICLQNKPDFELPEHKDNAEAQSAFQGLITTKKNLISIFADNGLEEIKPELGDEFDPNFHNALFQLDAPSAEIRPGQVGLVVKSGWKRKDILMRPADVGVVKPEE
eukprot:TRINITY_DN2298_c0_g1_i1.p1 TRINITY_DN2298_c0_g1~~TRINITY_DN2298_c0_g1_i1.p1  ORF type:complete len:226 (+),score=82.68 TRINITY_DN2298_c0_g1_i1:187-864(+)